MENYTLSEAKKLFASLYKDGKKEEAALLAREIMEKSPEAVSGYYYALVVETDNFKKSGDDKVVEPLFEKFSRLADASTAKKYADKLDALKKAKAEPKAKNIKPADAEEAVAGRKSGVYGWVRIVRRGERIVDGFIQGVFRSEHVLPDHRLGKRPFRFHRLRADS